MEKEDLISSLEDFAKECLHSQYYTHHVHQFTLYRCKNCTSVMLRLIFEHHTGSEEYNFRGIIWGECAECGYLMRLFTFTGDHRKVLRDILPVCDCGSRIFIAGQLERIEDREGIPGFFDEGVIAGKCTVCNRNQIFAYID